VTAGLPVRAIRLLVLAVLVAAAGLLLALSFVSYETLKAHVDAYAVDRNANLSRADFDRLVFALRLVGVALIAGAVGLEVARRRIDGYLTELLHTLRRSCGALVEELLAGIRGESTAHLVAVASVFGLGIALRVENLGLPMRYDEATTFNNYASKPLYIALSDYGTPNNHLLQTFLVHLSTAIFGTAPWAIRLPALLAGVLVVPATYLLVRLLYEKTAALIAAALAATSSTLIEYSTNARGYTLVALIFLLMLIVGTGLIETNSRLGWTLLTVLAILGLYTLPPALYAVGGAMVWILVSRLCRRDLGALPFMRRCGWSVGAVVIVTILLYAPAVAASGIGAITSNQFVSPKPLHEFVTALPAHLHATWDAWNRDLPGVVRTVLAIGFLGGLVLTPRLSKHPIPVVAAVVAWAAPVVALQRVVPYPRVWLFLVPLYLGTSAALLSYVGGRARALAPRAARPVAAIAIGVITWLTVLVVSSHSIRDSRETGALLDAPGVTRFLRGYLRPHDTLLATGSDSILEYYLRRDGIDPGPLLYAKQSGRRVLIVVNTLGGQTLASLAQQLRPSADWTRPTLVRVYPSARLYAVARGGAAN